MNSHVSYLWRGEFSSAEANRLHAEAFGTRRFTDSEWDWRMLVERHSLGWVTARSGSGLVHTAQNEVRSAGCEWLHVDFDAELSAVYIDTCGFSPTNAGLIHLTADTPPAP